MVKLIEAKSLWTGPNLKVKTGFVAEEEAEVALEAEVVAEVAEAELVTEAREALESKEASKEAEEEEATTGHKERRRSLNNFFYLSLPLPFERKDSGVFTLLPDQ